MTVSIRKYEESRRFLERFEIDRVCRCGRSGDATGSYLGPARREDLLRYSHYSTAFQSMAVAGDRRVQNIISAGWASL